MGALKEQSETEALKMQAKPRTADTKVVADQTRPEHVKHTAWISQLEGKVHELKVNLNFSKPQNNVGDLRYLLQVDECDLLNPQIASSGVCSAEVVQRHAKATKAVDASIDHLNCHAVYAQEAVRDTFCSKVVTLAKRPQTVFQLEDAAFFKPRYEAASDAVISLQGSAAHCQAAVRERLEQFAGRGGLQGGPSSLQGGPPSESVDPDSCLLDSVVVHLWYESLKMLKTRCFSCCVPINPAFSG